MSASASTLKTSNRLLLAVLLSWLFSTGAQGAPKVYLDVTKEAGRKISLAVTPFALAENQDEKNLRAILEQDLTLSGYFDLFAIGRLQRELFEMEQESGAIQFPSWAGWKVELLLRVTARVESGAVVLRGTLHDTASRKSLFNREHRGRTGQEARVVHSLVDEIILALTGERGISMSRIALSWANKGPKRVTIMDYDGRNVRPVSPEGVLSLFPAWFPDGQRLAYVTYRYGRTEVVVHDLQTGRIRSLAFFPGMNAFPAISPNGKSLLLTLSRDGNPEIYRMEVNGSSLKRLTFTKAVEASPVWSPDMRQIAFVSDRTGSPQVFVTSARGGRARRISYTGHYSTSPDWSPKGDRIIFTSLTEGTFQLYSIDLASGQNEQLTFDHGNKEDPSWAPNGRHLLYSQGRGGTYRLTLLDSRTGAAFPLRPPGGSFSAPAWSP